MKFLTVNITKPYCIHFYMFYSAQDVRECEYTQ